jgi:hypothetical protein
LISARNRSAPTRACERRPGQDVVAPQTDELGRPCADGAVAQRSALQRL